MSYAPFDLGGKCALVTGGNGGIGLGMADALAQAGADVCIWGTDAAKNSAAETRLAAHGTRIKAMICDISDETAVEDRFSAVIETFGRVDACFANAGVSSDRRQSKSGFAHMSTEEWRRVLSVNLDGSFFTLRAAAAHMLARGGGGALVATSSLAAMGQPRGEHYAASKGAINSMMMSLAVEYGGQGIRANAILPGWIETAMTAPAFGWDRFRDAVLPQVPAKRWGVPEDFGGLAVLLASDASAYITGQTILVDGGYSLF